MMLSLDAVSLLLFSVIAFSHVNWAYCSMTDFELSSDFYKTDSLVFKKPMESEQNKG